MSRRLWLPLLIAPAVALWGCGDSTNVTLPPLTPSVSEISPTGVVAGSADLPLTVRGHNFVAGVAGSQDGTRAVWVVGADTTLLPTNVVSTIQLTALIPAALLMNAGNAQVFVQTGDPPGTPSNAATFVVAPPPPKGGEN
jgi:hypothetical protein